VKTAELACEPIELKIEHVAIDSLRPDPANPRRIGERELESLTRSLQQFGFVQPVLVRKSDNVVIGGHQRLVAARRLGWKKVPVVFLDLSPEQARLLNLALNKISGQWDQELLARMLADLKPIEDIDLSLSGFSEEELGRLLKSLDVRDKRGRVETFDLEAALEAARADPGVELGDIWLLGDHRVMCGDATDSGDVSRLVGAQRASMAFTDPPYNVDLGLACRLPHLEGLPGVE
jgi:ParB-like chromosome segregation protein Spo0J